MAFIEARSLTKSFSFRKSNQVVFENLNFKIEKQEFVTLLGPSGCGKSTLLRLLGGLDQPNSGVIESQAQRKSFVFQEPRLLPWRNCLENTLLPLEIEKGSLDSSDQEKAKTTLSHLGLSESLEKYPHQLSGGMKMRNAVARSLILNPDFLLFDEPFAALDETTRHHLQQELRELFERNRWTLVFVTHSIEEACFLSDRILIFSKSRSQLVEHISGLPHHRGPSLRGELAFFDEIRKVRSLFEQEALS